MKTKLVKRHWCDFCNRAGLQERAMAKHEAHCTLNPDRKCRVCALLVDGMDSDAYEARKPLAELMAMLPDPTAYLATFCGSNLEDAHTKLSRDLDMGMEAFRAAAGNCPACMMAALRQKKIPVPMCTDFDFKSEMSDIFSDINQSRHPEY